MKIIILLIVTIAMNIFSQQDTPKTVKYVDIKKYAGLWYEIAKIPNRFQKQCVKGTTALYELKENGEIRVINSCYDKDNELDKTEGVARIVDNKSNATLESSKKDVLIQAGIRTYLDAAHPISHNKLMVIDNEVVITGSYNFTKNAERNAENIVILRSKVLANGYIHNWMEHEMHSEAYGGR